MSIKEYVESRYNKLGPGLYAHAHSSKCNVFIDFNSNRLSVYTMLGCVSNLWRVREGRISLWKATAIRYMITEVLWNHIKDKYRQIAPFHYFWESERGELFLLDLNVKLFYHTIPLKDGRALSTTLELNINNLIYCENINSGLGT